MRYWIKKDRKSVGPLTAEEIADIPDVGKHTLLCPEGRSPKKRKHWRFARTFPEMRKLLGTPGPHVKPRETSPSPEETAPAPAGAGVASHAPNRLLWLLTRPVGGLPAPVLLWGKLALAGVCSALVIGITGADVILQRHAKVEAELLDSQTLARAVANGSTNAARAGTESPGLDEGLLEADRQGAGRVGAEADGTPVDDENKAGIVGSEALPEQAKGETPAREATGKQAKLAGASAAKEAETAGSAAARPGREAGTGPGQPASSSGGLLAAAKAFLSPGRTEAGPKRWAHARPRPQLAASAGLSGGINRSFGSGLGNKLLAKSQRLPQGAPRSAAAGYSAPRAPSQKPAAGSTAEKLVRMDESFKGAKADAENSAGTHSAEWDGAKQNGGKTGGKGGTSQGGGSGTRNPGIVKKGKSGAHRKTSSSPGSKDLAEPVAGQNLTPYQGFIDLAKKLLRIAGLLAGMAWLMCMFAKTILSSPAGVTPAGAALAASYLSFAQFLASVAAALSAVVVMLGSVVALMGQLGQGFLLMAVGGVMAYTAYKMAQGLGQSASAAEKAANYCAGQHADKVWMKFESVNPFQGGMEWVGKEGHFLL